MVENVLKNPPPDFIKEPVKSLRHKFFKFPFFSFFHFSRDILLLQQIFLLSFFPFFLSQISCWTKGQQREEKREKSVLLETLYTARNRRSSERHNCVRIVFCQNPKMVHNRQFYTLSDSKCVRTKRFQNRFVSEYEEKKNFWSYSL